MNDVESASRVLIYLTVDEENHPIGTLSSESNPLLRFDLVLESEFTLWHDWEGGSVHFCGYTANQEYPSPGHIFF